MTSKHIEAIGHFLGYYRNDLFYINQFQNYKIRTVSHEDFICRKRGSFYSFLIEFRVVRNFIRGEVGSLLKETVNFIESNDCNDVDGFARHLFQAELTRKGIMASMASKILFLNNPYEIIPMDSLARKSLKQTSNIYTIYRQNIKDFKMENLKTLEEMLEYVKPLTTIIHQDYPLIHNADLIAENRMTDKLLWTLGKSK